MNEASGIDAAAAGTATVLSVSPHREDGACLERIFHGSGWTFLATPTLASAFSVLRERTVSSVLCEVDLFPGTWREMLTHISVLDDPPLLIVTSRLADERLWAEALNLGAYDVLATPFDAKEVIRIVDLARHRWRHRRELGASRIKPRQAAANTRLLCGEEADESNCLAG
jgi:DNA-binding response OmpR family regulator